MRNTFAVTRLPGGDRPPPAASGEPPLLPGPNATVRARASGGRPPRVASGDSPPAPWLVREGDLAKGERAPPTATLRSGAEFWRRRPPLRCKSGDAAPPSGEPAPSASDAAPASFPRSASSPPAFFPRGSGTSLIGMSRGRRTFTSVCEKVRPRSRSKIAATGSVLGPTIRALASVGDTSGVMSSPLMLRRVSECRVKDVRRVHKGVCLVAASEPLEHVPNHQSSPPHMASVHKTAQCNTSGLPKTLTSAKAAGVPDDDQSTMSHPEVDSDLLERSPGKLGLVGC